MSRQSRHRPPSRNVHRSGRYEQSESDCRVWFRCRSRYPPMRRGQRSYWLRFPHRRRSPRGRSAES
ncbi:hypothetical protein EVA_03247 [gut metagenome]|uniref:Uncharacterized protein n=1 Tax=gut metagenome TaxID=749906 RepID=J9GLA4_9ZZZZ